MAAVNTNNSGSPRYTFGQILERANETHLQQFVQSLQLNNDGNVRESIIRKLAEQNKLSESDQALTAHTKFNEYLSMTQAQLAQLANLNGPKSQLIRHLCAQTSPSNNHHIPVTTTQAPLQTQPLRIVSPRMTAPVQQPISSVATVTPAGSMAGSTFTPLQTNQAKASVFEQVANVPLEDKRYYHSSLTSFEENVTLLTSYENDDDGIYLGTVNARIKRYNLKKHEFDELPLLNFIIDDDDNPSDYLLLALVFHPHYEENGIFYLSYCAPVTKTGVHHVARCSKFTHSSESAYLTLQSEQVLIEQEYVRPVNTGGALILGPVVGGEYTLYYALGDGGIASSAQDLASYSGKMLQLYPSRNEKKIVAIGLSSPDNLYLSAQGHLYIIDNYHSYVSGNQDAAGVRIMRYLRGRNYLWPAAVNDNIRLDDAMLGYLSTSSPETVYTVAPINELMLHVSDGGNAISTVLDVNGECIYCDTTGFIVSLSNNNESKSPLITSADGRVCQLPEMYSKSFDTLARLLCHQGKLYQLIGPNFYALSMRPLLDEADINAMMMAIMSTVQASPSVFRKHLQQTAQGIAESQMPVAPVIAIYDAHSTHFIQSAAPGAWKEMEELTKEKAKQAYCYSSDNNALSTKDLTYLSEKDKPLAGIPSSGFGGVPLYKADRNGVPRLVGALAISGDSNEQNDYIAQIGAGAYAAPRQLGLPYM